MKQKFILETKIGFITLYSLNGQIIMIEILNNFEKILLPNNFDFDPFKNYFKAKSKNIQIQFKMIGTEFQLKVWNEICKIDYGKTKTYEDIAKSIGKPTSCRAVANACGQNKFALVIPCHRVVGKKDIGGYKWGIDKKKWLLDFEKKNEKKIS